jgi:hypothetical protein
MKEWMHVAGQAVAHALAGMCLGMAFIQWLKQRERDRRGDDEKS